MLPSDLSGRHRVILLSSVINRPFSVRAESVGEDIRLARLARLPLLLVLRVATHVLAQRQVKSCKVLWVAESYLVIVLAIVLGLAFSGCVDLPLKD